MDFGSGIQELDDIISEKTIVGRNKCELVPQDDPAMDSVMLTSDFTTTADLL